MKRKIIIAYPEFYLGGSTTSLISFLNSLDFRKYSVDLVLFRKKGEFLKYVPKEVNILDEVCKYKKDSILEFVFFILSYFFKGYIIKSFFFEIKYNKKFGFNKQILSKIAAKESKLISGKYDVGIGYLEFWGNDYIINHVDSEKKIAWIHTDYLKSNLNPNLDIIEFEKANNIVLVSKDCLTNFNSIFPQFTKKTIYIDNIISSKLVIEKSKEEILENYFDYKCIKIITVCRLDIYTKGIDRIINAIVYLSNKGYELKWYIIGEGPDRNKISKLIRKFNIEDKLFLLGRKINPFPYLVKCNLFAMPSRYEGKPISVTEAQILGVPVLVTNYSSAHDQVNHMTNGIIVENSEEFFIDGLIEILDNPNLLESFSNNLKNLKFENQIEIQKIMKLLD